MDKPALECDVKVTLDGNEVYFPDAKPFIDERNRALVPIRFVSELLGCTVIWDEKTSTVVITSPKAVLMRNMKKSGIILRMVLICLAIRRNIHIL